MKGGGENMEHNAEYKEKLSALLDGELSDAEREETLAHMEECETCRTYFAELSALRDALGDLEPVDVPEGFAAGVVARLHEENASKPAKKAGSWRRWGALAACAAVVVLAAAILPNSLRMGKSADSSAMTPMLAAPAAPAGGGDALLTEGEADETADAGDAALNAQLFRTEAAAAPSGAPEAAGPEENAGVAADTAEEKRAEEQEPDLLLYGEDAEFWLWNNAVYNEEQDGYWVDREMLRHLPDGLTLGTADMLARWNASGNDFAFVRAAETEAGR